MNTTRRAGGARSASSRPDRAFFSLAGLWFVVLTFVGFSPTFFLRADPAPLPAHQIVHGIVYSAWVILFFIQALLISTRRVRWHMALGAASIGLLLLMIPVGFHVVLVKTAAGRKSIDEAGFNLTELTLAFTFAFAGLANRRRPFVHKRLMLFATLMLTVAAADRASHVFGVDGVRIVRKLLAAAPGIVLVGYDSMLLRRVPVLSASLLAIVWAVIWFVVSDLVFLGKAGEPVIRALTKIFVL